MINMCGRVVVSVTYDEMASYIEESYNEAQFHVDYRLPRYNVSPSDTLVSLIYDGVKFRAGLLKWGYQSNNQMVPLINARAETIQAKPIFKSSFYHRRCLILVNGFYEWKKTPEGKTPYRFFLKDQSIFALAGIYIGSSDTNYTCAIITTNANNTMKPIHDRMPVILSLEDSKIWLQATNSEQLESLLHPFCDDLLIHPANHKVNNPTFDQIECLSIN